MTSRIRYFVALVVCLAVAPRVALADETKDDEAIRGTWKITSAIHDGKNFTEGAENVPVGDTLTFGKGTLKIGKLKVGGLLEGSFDLDPTKSPKHMDITLPDGTTELKGIYSLSGDELKICVGFPDEPRPEAFKAEKDQLRIVVVLKREKS
jgi:uncharacterized protein (TIGR03067 family)